MKIQVLFAYISISSGHQQAAKAIERCLKRMDQSILTHSVDSFSFAGYIVSNIVSCLYICTIRQTPKLWGYVYDNVWIKDKIKVFHFAIEWINSIRFYSLLKRLKPSVVVCTQAIPCGIISSLKRRGKINSKLIGVITDFDVHSYWYFSEVDVYAVATEEIKKKLVKNGIIVEKIKITGIPIDTSLNNPLSRNEIRAREGIAPGVKTILVMGGSRGFGKLEDIICQFDGKNCPYQIVIITGNNKKLKRKLERVSGNYKIPLKVYGYIDYVSEIMEACDLIITKPGGMTSSEALAKGLPMVIINPIPGQEEKNSDFLTRNGVAVQVDDIKEVEAKVKELLEDPVKLEGMKQASIRIAKPEAAEEISNIIKNLEGSGGKNENRGLCREKSKISSSSYQEVSYFSD